MVADYNILERHKMLHATFSISFYTDSFHIITISVHTHTSNFLASLAYIRHAFWAHCVKIIPYNGFPFYMVADLTFVI